MRQNKINVHENYDDDDDDYDDDDDDDDDDVGYVQDVEVEDEMVLQMKTFAIIWWEKMKLILIEMMMMMMMIMIIMMRMDDDDDDDMNMLWPVHITQSNNLYTGVHTDDPPVFGERK